MLSYTCMYNLNKCMKTYIINLAESVERKEYMKRLLIPFSVFDVEFIEGVDGRVMTESERAELFDEQKAYAMYGRKCKPGEIGCTLSHQKCYRRLAEGAENYALILEDDIAFEPAIVNILPLLEKEIDVEQPRIILLSGGYWYWRKKKSLIDEYSIVSVYDAYFTHAYLINKSAANKCILQKAYILADDWKYISSQGVEMQACFPHLIGQLPEEKCQSLIFNPKESRGMIKANMSIVRQLRMYFVGGMKKLLALLGKYEEIE